MSRWEQVATSWGPREGQGPGLEPSPPLPPTPEPEQTVCCDCGHQGGLHTNRPLAFPPGRLGPT